MYVSLSALKSQKSSLKGLILQSFLLNQHLHFAKTLK